MRTLSELVRETMNRCGITRTDPFTVGFSGGRDSVCLVHLLYKLGYTGMQAVYVHHGLRNEADGEALWTRRFCDERGIRYRCMRVSAAEYAGANGLSIEEAARILRYQALGEAAGDHKVILTAHHAEDQAETLLLHLMRGSGLTGLTGMRECSRMDIGFPASDRTPCRIIRPLLEAGRGQIEEYLQENSLSWLEDDSNDDIGFTRNWIRRELLPLMRQQNPAVTQALCRTAELLRTDEDYLQETAEQAYRTASEQNAIRTDALGGLPEAVRRRVLRLFITETSGLHDVGEAHIRQLGNLCRAGTGTETMLPGGQVFRKEYGRIVALGTRGTDQQPAESTAPFTGTDLIADGLWHPAGEYEYRAESADAESLKQGQIPDMPYTKWLNCDKVKSRLRIRTRLPGDRIAIGCGHKKLQDVLVDAKIPERERDRILLVADGQDIIWIVGGRISADSYIGPDTENILQIECRKRQEEEGKQ